MTLHVWRRTEPLARLGITVSRKVGNAVQRNRDAAHGGDRDFHQHSRRRNTNRHCTAAAQRKR